MAVHEGPVRTAARTVLDRFRLDGQVAFVTGARKGIGKACAQGLAEAGARVAISSRDGADADQAAKELQSRGLEVVAVPGDVSSYEDVEAMSAAVEDRLGPIDVLVNNAGTVVHLPALEVSGESWRSVMSVNLDAVWYCSQVVGRSMVERRKGAIVNIGSISGIIVNRPQWQPAYNASKAAVHQLTRSLAGEWAQYGVRVNALALGYVSTDMTGEIVDPDRKRWWVEDVPMGRMATVEEVAPAVVFLASEASSFVTGSVMVVDGGYTVW
ncbi:MAG TPA: SDR family oxidoreductase [Acidimicrobiales bacterium]|nr:SDR family oxidoreductase [Acidimicrobiales bacterium]